MGKFFLVCDYGKTALYVPSPHFASQRETPARRLHCGLSTTIAFAFLALRATLNLTNNQMLVPCCNIRLEAFQDFRFCTNLEINSSFKNLSDTASLSFPKNLKTANADLRSVLKKGQTAEFQLGYENQLNSLQTEFKGYLTTIQPSIPFVLTFEDEMWALKRKNYSAAFRRVSLKELLQTMLSETGLSYYVVSTGEIDLGKLRIEQQSPAQVLAELREKYGIYSFFRDGKLFSGLPYTSALLNTGMQASFSFQRDILAHNLEFVAQDSIKIAVQAISILPDNSRIEVRVGDIDGEVHTKHYFGISDKSKLTQLAEADLVKMKLGGYNGSFTTLGSPAIRFGDSIQLLDSEYPERTGRYLVEATTVRFGLNGFKREITIGQKLE